MAEAFKIEEIEEKVILVGVCLYSVFNFTGGCFWVSICIYNDGSNS